MFQHKIKFLLVILFFSLTSCNSTDLFVKESQNSSLNVAMQFVEKYANPRHKKGVHKAYDFFSVRVQDHLSYHDFYNVVIEKFYQKQIIPKKIDVSIWEKVELSDGSCLVYILTKSKFNIFTASYGFYAIFRLKIIKEHQKWVVDIDKPGSFNGILPIKSGKYSKLTNDNIFELRQMVKEDAEKFEFRLSILNLEKKEITLSKKCISEGERLYDLEEYRKALMQFQKALSIDPENKKASVYINRCKKAISLGLQS